MKAKGEAIINKVNGIAQFMGRQIIAPDGFMGRFVEPEILVSMQTLGNKIINGTMNILLL